MTTSTAQIAARLKARAASYFPEFAGEDVVVAPLPFKERSTYPLHLFSIQSPRRPAGRQVVVKFAPVTTRNVEGLTEYRNLRHMFATLAGAKGGVGVPRPLDYLSDIHALVTEHVDVERFSAWFARVNAFTAGRETVDALRNYISQAGYWLRVYHESTSLGAMPLAETGVEQIFDRLLTQLERRSLLAGRREKIRTVLRQVLRTAGGTPVPMARVHGDYGLQNMGVANGKLYVFDLQRDHAEVVYHDLAYFLVTLETMNPYPRRPLFSRRRALALQADFLDRYFGAPRDPSHEARLLHHLFYLRNLLTRCLKQSQNVRERMGGLAAACFARLHAERAYARRVERELRALVAAVDILGESHRTSSRTSPAVGRAGRASSGSLVDGARGAP